MIPIFGTYAQREAAFQARMERERQALRLRTFEFRCRQAFKARGGKIVILGKERDTSAVFDPLTCPKCGRDMTPRPGAILYCPAYDGVCGLWAERR